MATSNKSKRDTTMIEEPETTAVTESVYDIAELAKNHKAFNTSYEIVSVALKLSGKKTATFNEAKTIVEEFKNKEVK